MVKEDGTGVGVKSSALMGMQSFGCYVKGVGKAKDRASRIRKYGWLQGIRVQKELAW